MVCICGVGEAMFYFFIWRDVVEIVCFSALSYYVMITLKKTNHSNLLFLLLSYCLIFFVAYVMQLPTISLLCTTWPSFWLLFFILVYHGFLHEDDNRIKKRRWDIGTLHDKWLSLLMQSCLKIVNNNKKIVCVIEHTDPIDDFVTAPFIINTILDGEMLEFFSSSTLYDPQKLVWINTQGKLIGVNVTNTISGNWQQAALVYTGYTDALVFSIDPSNRMITIVHRGKLFKDLALKHGYMLIKKAILIPQKSKQNRISHEIFRKKYAS